jgi:group I intron endonuclease
MTRLQPFFSTIEQSIGYLHLAKIQKIIRKELKGKSGIYGFLSKTNNKLYIGSSKTLPTRFNEHIKGSKSNAILQKAINKYNLHDFIFIVFEYCEPEELISREQFYIDNINPDYNINPRPGFSLGYIHTEESIAKMSDKIFSAETKVKMSLAKLGKKSS